MADKKSGYFHRMTDGKPPLNEYERHVFRVGLLIWEQMKWALGIARWMIGASVAVWAVWSSREPVFTLLQKLAE